MALKRAERTGGGFVDLKDVVRSNDGKPVTAVFGIREFLEPEKGDFGYLLPVIADLLIVDGEQAGTTILGQRWQGAITSALRGVANPNKDKGERPSAPVTEVGDDIACVLVAKNAGKNNEYVVGNEPTESQMDAIMATDHFDAEGECLAWERAREELAGEGAKAPASSGSSGDRKSSRPWGSKK